MVPSFRPPFQGFCISSSKTQEQARWWWRNRSGWSELAHVLIKGICIFHTCSINAMYEKCRSKENVQSVINNYKPEFFSVALPEGCAALSHSLHQQRLSENDFLGSGMHLCNKISNKCFSFFLLERQVSFQTVALRSQVHDLGHEMFLETFFSL